MKIYESLSAPLRRRLVFCVFVIVVLVMLSVFFLLQRPASGACLARITQDGRELQTIDLSAVTEPYVLRIDSPDGGYNVISVAPGCIGVVDADCPDHICMQMGMISSSVLPVTCLPHRLVIEIIRS